RGDYRIRVNSRKVLDGILETAGVDPFGDENVAVRLTVLRAVDKLDRLGTNGVEQLLGKGRKDESGDFTPGAGLSPDQISALMRFVEAAARSLAGQSSGEALSALGALVGDSACGREGLADLEKLSSLVEAAGFGADRIVIDPAIVRGLDYYTGPVFEAELTFEHRDEDGILTRFGSVGGGGRYDGLVARFKGAEVPATGFSIGVSRLVSALLAIDSDVLKTDQLRGPVVVLALGDDGQLVAQEMVQELRSAGIRAEPYLGTAGMKAQLKYADRRGAAVAVIAGEDERAAGQVTLKDLDEGARLSAEIADNTEWRSGKPAQTSVARGDLVAGVRAILADSAKG
ncbi:MAG: HisS family protein, partial [Pseudomonadota bacterium]